MIEPLITAFVIALISEVADKTQLVILGLALKYKSPFRVFSGALLAHSFMDGLAIFIGAFFGFTIPAETMNNAVGALFILLGVWGILKIYYKQGGPEKSEHRDSSPLIASFLTVLVSEFGDKTQISSGLLAASYRQPGLIFFGFVLGLSIAIGLNVFLGSRIAERLPRRSIKIATALIFIFFGLITLSL